MTNQPIKILLIESDVGDAGLLRAALHDVGSESFPFEFDHVICLGHAVDRLREKPFDVLLLALTSPDSPGVGAVTSIREEYPNIPIVVMSGLDDEQVAVEAMRNGAEDYLVKGQLDSTILIRTMTHAIERKRVFAELRAQRERLAALHAINLAVTSTLDLHDLVEHFLDKITLLFPHLAVTIRLLDGRTGVLEPLACRNVDAALWRTNLSPEGGARMRAVLTMDRPLMLSDVLREPRGASYEFMHHNGLVSYVGVRLAVKGDPLGVVGFYTREWRDFPADEVEMLGTLAGQVAVAIYHSRLYAEVKEARDALEKALEAKSVLVGVMAHELKNPIQVIMGNANLLSEGAFGELTAEQRERVHGIENSSLELVALIESAVDMARRERGKISVRVAAVSVNSILQEIYTEFEAAFRTKGIDFTVTITPPTTIIKTDPLKLREILRNLIENSRKFTSTGKVMVHFHELDRERVEFVVADTGRGIRSDLLPKIFELFYQEDSSQREYASAGLGLNIVKRLVSAMSGEISVTSELGKGTTFRVVLPVAVESSDPVA
jgi:signal transduction histidine kinase/DNA-binding NarL/FixJ family response regulator